MILNVYKEQDMTSRDVVNILGKHFHTKKVGHTGTLDPLASGVLLLCFNEGTKFVELLTAKTKEYIATMRLGMRTDTGDITGQVLETKTYAVNETLIKETLNSMLGESIQTVPIYSAVKINGKKLYEYARTGQSVELPKRTIHIYDIELLEYHDDTIKFRVVVSKGTYIRSIIEDIALKLNTLGTMTDLIRTKQGNFNIQNSDKISSILEDNYHEITHDYLFKDYPKLELDYNTYIKVSNGVKLPFSYTDDIIALTYQNNYIALYKKDNDIYRMYKKL
jgi:tRNA pseudouridine55 synthase